ncbi:MAG: cyclic nucleotide-binding domain-containing protein, partial [Acidimicrobiia bacterium]|nr:cyclic nucleotide-binding domain-containing protein [Acidimicrobiia bacterium]
TDTLLDALWSEGEVARPESALYMAVNRLRAAIGEEHILTEPGGYRLNIPISNSDVSRFRALVQRGSQLLTLGHPTKACEHLRHGLAQWRGPALTDLRQFEFAEQAARQLEEERLAAVEHLMEASLAAGEHDQVVGELFGLVHEFPYRERMWELLMLALYRSGRQAEALSAFKDVRKTLGEELGIEPTRDLVDLEERILLHDPALEAFEPAREELSDDVEYISFSPGDLIVEQGDLASLVYWVEEGRVEILKTDDTGKSHRLTELGPGRYFGELAVTLGTRRTASVRAVAATTVSAHDLESFRTRLGLDRMSSGVEVHATEELWDLVRRGEYLDAYDRAAGLIEIGDTAPEVRYLAVLALARAGATAQAHKRYEQYGLGTIDPDTMQPKLAGDIAVLSARLDKDEALARLGSENGTGWAKRAASGYEAVFDRTGAAYHGTNAATMWLVAGDEDRAMELAARAVEGTDSQDHGYWDAVTEAEAALVLGDVPRAEVALATAGNAGQSQFADRASTLKQLKLVCRLKGIDPGVLAPIRNPTIVHYCGHRIMPAGEAGRFPAEEEPWVREELRRTFDALDAGVGFGSLAAGADILAAEVLLERGAELHVVLPFDKDEFVRTSVISAGSEWVHRFERCLNEADSVEIASAGEYLDDPVMFDYCARIAMGDTLMRARFLESDAHQVAVWDGTPSDGVAGTAVDVTHWSATGAPSTMIGVQPGPAQTGASDVIDRRTIRAIVFADFAGFSKLSDAQIVTFQQTVMTALARTLEPYRPQLLAGNTWGDSVHLVFGDVPSAAECALDLVAAVAEMDMDRLGLHELRGLRIGAHAAPVFEGWDPISGSHLYYGAGITKAARIEPRTPEGEIYTTHA